MINIVIAEDDFRIANIHEEFIKEIEGVSVIGKAINGEQTLSLIKEWKPELLLLDLYLPDYLGTDLIQDSRKIHPDLDVVIITAATEKELLENSLRKGITNYLIKPVSMEKFNIVINEYKQKKNLLQYKEHINQDVVDELLLSSRLNKRVTEESLPKGIDKITLSKVKYNMEKNKKSWSAEEMGEKIGSSRTTARRYLEYLVQLGLVNVEQEYGIIGRPERRYYLG
ncbi:response regulator [Lentibacillus sp. CBA3610]|uniref:response regulator n=1 Tax=Lentibacillus sp. CBA3610 TaxID=2518176 RepID=UPI001595B883|nr:response regulator [Lentibacillus sp. CBA3610]QKY68431.1 response regulator [Lentibacillus sp. CBA3610]